MSIPGFDQSIERHKKVQREKSLQREADERIMLGQRYSKEKLNKFKPPSFWNKPIKCQLDETKLD